jgi:hypothetical protein
MPDFSGFLFPYIQRFDEAQRFFRVSSRIPISLSNLAKGMVFDTLKAKRLKVAQLGGIHAQIRGFTYKA